MSAAGQLSEELTRLCERYQQAWKIYLAHEWDLVEATFRECLQVRPNDGPSRVFLERIQLFRRNPPGKDWNGVWQLIEKSYGLEIQSPYDPRNSNEIRQNLYRPRHNHRVL